MPLINEIQEAFGAELNRRLGVQRVSVTSARELDSGEKEGLGAVLERLTGMKIEARYGRDERLIGGAIAQIGSTIYDGSVREQLNRLKAAWNRNSEEQAWLTFVRTKSQTIIREQIENYQQRYGR